MHDDSRTRLRLGRQRLPPVPVPDELFRLYQRLLGPVPTLLWLNLRWLIQVGAGGDPLQLVANTTGLDDQVLSQALQVLVQHDLAELMPDGSLRLHEPLTQEGLALRMKGQASRAESELMPAAPVQAETAAVDLEATDAELDEEDPLSRDEARVSAELRACLQAWEEKIGLVGPATEARLYEWVAERKMAGEVVVASIHEAAQSGRGRIEYVEGVLRNWYNDGVRTYRDLLARPHLTVMLQARPEERRGRQTGGRRGGVIAGTGAAGAGAGAQESSSQGGAPAARVTGGSRSAEGMANAVAYRVVDPKQVKRWKELYPDEQ